MIKKYYYAHINRVLKLYILDAINGLKIIPDKILVNNNEILFTVDPITNSLTFDYIDGIFNIKIEKEGYISNTVEETSYWALNNKTIVLARELAYDSVTIVTHWEPNVSGKTDLDSHLLIYDSNNGNKLSEVYHAHKSYQDLDSSVIKLDVDDTLGQYNSTETVTISKLRNDRDYIFVILDYDKSAGQGRINQFKCKIEVSIGNNVYKFNTPTGTGIYWNAFKISDGNVVALADNTITTDTNVYLITK